MQKAHREAGRLRNACRREVQEGNQVRSADRLKGLIGTPFQFNQPLAEERGVLTRQDQPHRQSAFEEEQ